MSLRKEHTKVIPLDNPERITAKMKEQNAIEVLEENEQDEWKRIPEEDKAEALKNIIFYPVGHNFNPAHWVVYNWFIKTRWLEALQAINLAKPASMLELATGSNVMIPQVFSRFYTHPETQYTTVNLNKQLTADFKQHTKDLPLKINIIEDAAQNIEDYFSNKQADVVIFEHAFNDIVEDIIARKFGIDTINTSWWDILPKLIELTNEVYLNGTYEEMIKEDFLRLLRSSLKVLKPSAFLVSYQFQFQFDIDLGIIPDIWTDLISTVRKWVKEANIGEEVFFDGFEPNWWMFLRA